MSTQQHSTSVNSSRLCVAVIGFAFLFCTLAMAGRAQGQTAEHKALGVAVQQKVQAAFGLDPNTVSGDAALLMTRSLAAKMLTEAINRSQATIAYTVPAGASFLPPPTDLKTATHDDARLECSPDQFCNWGCDQSFPPEKWACEANKSTCKLGQKVDCERRKALAQSISDKKIATVSFSEASVKGSATASRIGATISPALDAITLRSDLTASLTVNIRGHVSPEPLVVASGCGPHDFKFDDEPVSVGQSGLAVSSQLTVTAEGDHLLIQIAPSKPTVTLHFAGTPALRFLARNPLAVMACTVPYAIAGLADLTHPNDMAKRDIELPLPAQVQSIGSVTTNVDGWEIKSVPTTTAKALGVLMQVLPPRAPTQVVERMSPIR